MHEDDDISDTIVAKSDQLNAADLIDNPITVQVTGVKIRRNEDQPVALEISGGWKPWKPCKTARRVLIAMWGKHANQYVGRWLTLYNNPDVEWAGKAVGGIRISEASNIRRPVEMSLLARKGKYEHIKVTPLRPPQQERQPEPEPPKRKRKTADLAEVLEDARLTVEAVDAWRESEGKPPVADLTDEQRGVLAHWLAADESRLDTVRAFADAIDDSDEIPL